MRQKETVNSFLQIHDSDQYIKGAQDKGGEKRKKPTILDSLVFPVGSYPGRIFKSGTSRAGVFVYFQSGNSLMTLKGQ
jgi:hypothetical protein